MINQAHLHLLLVHIPVVLMPTAAVFLLIALWRGSRGVAQVGYALCIAAALMSAPAFLLGEGAEEVLEHFPGVNYEALESQVEEHEEAGEVALWSSVGAGIVSVVALFVSVRGGAQTQVLPPVVFVVSLISSGALGYTAYRGGMIRHPEAYVAPAPHGEEAEENEAEHEHRGES